MYPAIQVQPEKIEDIFVKGTDKIDHFKANDVKLMAEHSEADWLDEKINVSANWVPILSLDGTIEGVLGVQCPLSTKMSCLSKSGAA